MRKNTGGQVEQQMCRLFAESGMSGWHVKKKCRRKNVWSNRAAGTAQKKIVGAQKIDRTVPLAQLKNSSQCVWLSLVEILSHHSWVGQKGGQWFIEWSIRNFCATTYLSCFFWFFLHNSWVMMFYIAPMYRSASPISLVASIWFFLHILAT